jgi:hypothetical protein
VRVAAGGRGRVLEAAPRWRSAGGVGGAGGRGVAPALCVARAEPGLCPLSLGARQSGGGAANWAGLGWQSRGAVLETIGGVGPRVPPLSRSADAAPLVSPLFGGTPPWSGCPTTRLRAASAASVLSVALARD